MASPSCLQLETISPSVPLFYTYCTVDLSSTRKLAESVFLLQISLLPVKKKSLWDCNRCSKGLSNRGTLCGTTSLILCNSSETYLSR
ncbi:uncharacterized protein BJ212DRAFT_1419757 [Suillus subaureus]|uniref:Uncharacterized protein n=1 Tax=Suillus subaureus TaxID=48587 RepID=A0A9P7AKB2_9AGAM|nr:uncharacterized protein BJ212DRAFT_1419757 [Suillus subaureus]KAG1791270.1 hypothetical protein BJ212DRAFT_1419757 [Suillus subaureus]